MTCWPCILYFCGYTRSAALGKQNPCRTNSLTDFYSERNRLSRRHGILRQFVADFLGLWTILLVEPASDRQKLSSAGINFRIRHGVQTHRQASVTLEIALILFAAGTVAGAVNAFAGGATLLTFPVLMAVGLPPTVANATNFVAVLPGNAFAIPAYREQLREQKADAARLLPISLAGGVVGAIALIFSSDNAFLALVPWMILGATLLYAFGDRINRIANGNLAAPSDDAQHPLPRFGGMAALFVFSIYGGYFGAGLGVITLATLKIMGYLEFHQANALKNLTNTAVGITGVALFTVSGLVSWPHAIVMMTGAALGGYASARLTRHIPQAWLHWAIVVLGLCLSIYYFVK